MAKTYNNLFPRIYDFHSLHQAYVQARRGKRDRREVQRFEQDLEGNLIALQNELIWGMYQTGQYRLFHVYEPKERLVAALPFRDRVLQHSLISVIEPIWESRFIADSYACRPGRGTHRGADRAQSMLRSVQNQHGHVYVLKADIAKYFYSIDHAILKRLIRRRIRCARTLDLIDAIIDSNAPEDDLCPVGLPIGNLTSQLFANVYLHELDTYVKHHLRERHYVRYMDDFVIVHPDKAHLQRLRVDIERFLWDNLRLRTNAKTQVFPVGVTHGRALDFLGYRMWTSHRRIRRSSVNRIKRTMRRLQKRYSAGKTTLERVQQSVQSWVAHASHAQTYGLRRTLLSGIRFTKGAPGKIR